MSDRFGHISISQDQDRKTQKKRSKRRKPSKPEPEAASSLAKNNPAPKPPTVDTGSAKQVKSSRPEKPVKQQKVKKTQKPQRKKREPKKPSFYISLFLCLTALLGITYTVGGFYFVPMYLKEKLPTYFAENTHTVFTMDGVKFNPFTFDISVKNIQLSDAENDRQLLHFPELKGTISGKGLIQKNIVFTALDIHDPKLELTRFSDGEYDLVHLLHPDGNGAITELFNSSDISQGFSLNNIHIINGHIQLLDKETNKTHTVEHLALTLPSIANIDFPVPISGSPMFTAVINGSPLEIVPSSDAEGSAFTLDMEGMDLPYYTEYLPFQLPLQLKKGKGKCSLKLAFQEANDFSQGLSIQFSLEASEIETKSSDDKLVLTSEKGHISGAFLPFSNNFHIKNFTLTAPEINLAKDFNLNSLHTFFPHAENKEKQPAKTVLQLKIDTFSFQKGRITQQTNDGNRSLYTNLRLNLADFTNSIKNGEKEQASQQGKLQFVGTSIQKQADFLFDAQYNNNGLAGMFELKNISLAAYCTDKSYFARKLCTKGTGSASGTLTLKAKDHGVAYTVTGGNLNAQNLTVIDDNGKPLSIPSAKVTGFSSNGKSTRIKKVELEKFDITLSLTSPPSFSKILSKKYRNLQVESFDLNGKVNLQASNNTAPLKLNKISVNATEKGDNKKIKEITLKAQNGKKGTLKGTGTYSTNPFATKLNIEFKNLDAPSLISFASPSKLGMQTKASVGGKGTFSFPARTYTGSLFTGKSQLLVNKKILLEWKSSWLGSVKLNMKKHTLQVGGVELRSPKAYFEPLLLTAKGKDPVSQSLSFFKSLLTSKQGTCSLRISNFVIQDGLIQISDSDSIKALNGQIKNLRYPATKGSATFNFKAKRWNKDFTLGGETRYAKNTPSTSYVLSFSDIPLIRYSNYVEKVHLASDKGAVSGMITGSINGSGYSGKARLSAKNVEPFDPLSKTGIALAFLRGKSNKFPLEFTLKKSSYYSPETHAKKGMDAFKLIQTKAEFSPFLLAKEDFSDLADNTSVLFEPGKDLLTAKTTDILLRYAHLLASHPYLSIAISGRYRRTTDEQIFLKHLEEEERIRTEKLNDIRYKEWEEQNRLEAQRRERELAEKMAQAEAAGNPMIVEEELDDTAIEHYVPLKPEPVEVPQEMLDELAKSRADQINSYLLDVAHVNKNQVFVIQLDPNKDADGTQGVEITLATLFPPR